MKRVGEMSVKRIIRSLAASLVLSCIGVGHVHAANPDSIVLSVTPGGINYAVQITSPITNVASYGYDFKSVNFGATTVSTLAIHVANPGNTSEYFALAISATSPDSWSAISSGTPGLNQFLMLGHVLSTGSPQPAPSVFDVNNDTMTATLPTIAAGRYGQSAQTNPGATTDLWLRLTMPTSATSAAAQTMTLTINGQAN
jgi:hypothetical protein